MKAMVLHAPSDIAKKPLQLQQMPIPQPAAGQLRIKISHCAVCHTDLHIAEGEISPSLLPLIPGHQVVGTVDKTGDAADSGLLGTRVGIPWLHSTCGGCDYCNGGMENLCQAAAFTGFDQHGGFAEYCLANNKYVVRIPPEMSNDAQVAPLLCGGIIGYRSLHLCGVKNGERLGLFGFGSSAHIVLQIARARDMEVYVFTRSQKNQKIAQRLGAAWVGGPEHRPRVQLSAAISFTPSGASLKIALERIRPGGTVACAGIYTSPIPELDYQQHLYNEKSLRSVTALTRQDAAGLMAAAARYGVTTEIEMFSLEQANEALLRLKNSGIKGSAAVLKIG